MGKASFKKPFLPPSWGGIVLGLLAGTGVGLLTSLVAFVVGINLFADAGSMDTGLAAVLFTPHYDIQGFLAGLATLLLILTHKSPGG